MVLKSKVTKKIIRNPRDEEFLKKIKIEKERKHKLIHYFVILNNESIGHASIADGNNYIFIIDILPEYQRKGIASYLYDYIEKDLNIKLVPSEDQLLDGKSFWKSRSKKNPSPNHKNARPFKTPKTKIPR